MFYFSGSMEFLSWPSLRMIPVLPLGLAMAQNKRCVLPYSPTGERCYFLHGSSAEFVGFMILASYPSTLYLKRQLECTCTGRNPCRIIDYVRS
jgi:hypothetical protein